jgi:type II secretory pathway pseudopilin PulG
MRTCSTETAFSVLEVLLAIVVLSISTTVVLRFVLTGDILFGRNLLIENAAQLASNEIETLKAEALVSDTIEGKEYEASLGGRKFMVARNVLPADSVDALLQGYDAKGIELLIYELQDGADYTETKPLVSLKYLQGFNVK